MKSLPKRRYVWTRMARVPKIVTIRHTIKLETPGYRNSGKLAEQWSTGKTIGIHAIVAFNHGCSNSTILLQTGRRATSNNEQLNNFNAPVLFDVGSQRNLIITNVL